MSKMCKKMCNLDCPEIECDDADKIYAVGLNGYRNTSISKKQNDNDQYEDKYYVELPVSSEDYVCEQLTLGMGYAKAKECKPEDTFDIRIEEQHGFPYEDSKYNGFTQSKDASPHSLDYGFVSSTKLPIECPRSLSPPKKSSSTSKRKQQGKKYFLPIRQIDQLRRLIKLKDA
ncbi:hypothetical protein CTI12_AA548020 [Artemisia annua]|uniref:Uncharacterized protein n=1 Tax=Artemisia annua TaxID=35608 RepID=A0A2U1L053_ARTAN|nr:hypothetical protein CTI12_AA548020 [Artemisia annua]